MTEQLPSPGEFDSDTLDKLARLNREYVEEYIEDHRPLLVKLGAIVDTSRPTIEEALPKLNLLVDCLLENFDIEPERWAEHLVVSDGSELPDPSTPDQPTAAEFLFEEAMKNVFSWTEERWFGGCSLRFTADTGINVELRSSSQFVRIRTYRNPQTGKPMHEVDDKTQVEWARIELGDNLTILHENVETEISFNAIFLKESD
jgi:hypothetical protein